ncbi:MAG: hypothetical protein CM1200mP27_08880 [Chloroflexota bacterium]|nr:MAG: hypothetical protein CM1200mP27_08880 [Chloroflexota bacterium]
MFLTISLQISLLWLVDFGSGIINRRGQAEFYSAEGLPRDSTLGKQWYG